MDTALALTTDMQIVLGLVALTMLLFLFQRVRADLVALVVLVLLGLTGQVAPEDVFNGFSSNAVISVIATMILGLGLDRTGALNRLAGWLLRRARGVEERLLLLTATIAGLNSSIMQNPSVMALYLPVISRLSSRTGISLARMLLPVGVAIVMGGTLTMVGNSPLIMLNDLLVSANANLPSGAATLTPLNMFAPAPIGLALLAAGLAYFHFHGNRQLRGGKDASVAPARTQSYFARVYGIDGDMFELTVTADSPLVGMTFGEAESLHNAPVLLALKVEDEARLAPAADVRIWVGSVIGAMGTREQVADFAQNNFLRLSTRLRQFGDLFNPARAGISEAVVPPNSDYIGKTANELQLRRHHGLRLLAVNRDKDKVIRENVRDLPLRAGDMLVLHSFWKNLVETAADRDFVVVTDYPKGEQRPHKFKIAMAIFAVTILIALSGRVPTAIALMTGVAGMLVTGVLKMDESYSAINWKTVFLMACLIPLGWAMDRSGAAAWVAGASIEQLPDGLPVWLIQVAVAILTTGFSLVISHVGATIVMVPLAINLALAVGADPTSFALIVALAASNNFMTQSNPVMSMITGPGGYRAKQLWVVCGPLSLVYTLIIVLMVNLLF